MATHSRLIGLLVATVGTGIHAGSSPGSQACQRSEEDEVAGLVQLNRALGSGTKSVDPVAEKEMLRIINEAFQGLGDASGGKDIKAVEDSAKSDLAQGWRDCASLDYSSFKGVDSKAVHQLQEKIGLNRLCKVSDPTCKAFDAALSAQQRILQLGERPRMQNYSLVNWVQNEVGFPAWGSDPDGSRVGVDYSVSPPVADARDKTAGSGFALCELVTTTLQNSNFQLFNSCGPTAVLAALIIRSPVQALKKGLQLFYTGTLPELSVQPCPYIYEQQPGIMPYNASQPGFNKFPAGTNMCPGEAVQAEGGTLGPCQAVGIQKMWISTFLSAYDVKLRKQMGIQDVCGRKIFQSLYPLEPEKDAQLTRNSHLTAPAAILFMCEVALGGGVEGSCQYSTPSFQACSTATGFSLEACANIVKGVGITTEDLGDLFVAIQKPSTMEQEFAKITARPSFELFLSQIPGATKQVGIDALLRAQAPSSDSVAQAALLQQACDTEKAMLFMDAEALNKPNAPVGQCNHWIVLDSCAQSDYKVWTWGSFRFVNKAYLERHVCGVLLHGTKSQPQR
ncbi:unnamed protein product [Polarella glacialis]|uniref:Uncharacterized protein n=2 Tax=Polarella glacialis TaxID=89957 RepID=A0A813J8N9_POLGL|nr:unnamed protein product [Polarella glacialis]